MQEIKLQIVKFSRRETATHKNDRREINTEINLDDTCSKLHHFYVYRIVTNTKMQST